LPALATGGPYELSVKGAGSPEVVVRDILCGEVWVCSGQSNMEWPLSSVYSPIPEVLRADHPRLRLYSVPRRISAVPLDDIDSAWTPCTPETAGPFSAIGYYFGLEILKALDVPVGLIDSSWGGTDIEPWTPPAGFAAVPSVKPLLDATERREQAYRRSVAESLSAWQAWLAGTKSALAAGKPLPAKPAQPAASEKPDRALVLPRGTDQVAVQRFAAAKHRGGRSLRRLLGKFDGVAAAIPDGAGRDA
jgi:sialate O-acetylesterase